MIGYNRFPQKYLRPFDNELFVDWRKDMVQFTSNVRRIGEKMRRMDRYFNPTTDSSWIDNADVCWWLNISKWTLQYYPHFSGCLRSMEYFVCILKQIRAFQSVCQYLLIRGHNLWRSRVVPKKPVSHLQSVCMVDFDVYWQIWMSAMRRITLFVHNFRAF